MFLYSYNTRSSFTADYGREKVLGTVRKSWRMLEMLQFLITHLRDLVSCHEAILFFKLACQVCQPKLYIYNF